MSKKSHHFLMLWPWPLTYDLEKLIRSGHYHYQCVYQIWEQSIPWFLSYRVNTIEGGGRRATGGGRLRRKTITSPDPSDTGDIMIIILTTCTTWVLRSDGKYRNIFMSPQLNSACHGLCCRDVYWATWLLQLTLMAGCMHARGQLLAYLNHNRAARGLAMRDCICLACGVSIDLLHKSHIAPVLYPTMHHFVTEMCWIYIYTYIYNIYIHCIDPVS